MTEHSTGDEQAVAAKKLKIVTHHSLARRLTSTAISAVLALSICSGTLLWLGSRASIIDDELTSATDLVARLKSAIAEDDRAEASLVVSQIRNHTGAAREAADDPVWTLATNLPFVGQNLGAVAEVARTADDVSTLGLAPLVEVFSTMRWESLLPQSTGTDLQPLRAAAPRVSGASHAVRESADRLARVDTTRLLPQIAEPLSNAREQLQEATQTLEAAASAAQIAPDMLGADGQRDYLLVIQNNSESRATGGIPGALAIVNVDNGSLNLGTQSGASDVGIMSPVIPVSEAQRQIYSNRLGKFMQDVNLTPDFPTAATTAQAMWERKTGQRVDGVIAVDPIVLGYILKATGPVQVSGAEFATFDGLGLPQELNSKNVVPTLLSDVYGLIEEPRLQDEYFASVARRIFAEFSEGEVNARELLEGITRGAAEGRVLVWSNSQEEQQVLAKYPISGSITGPSVSPAQFGVYFNDGTGAKMDFHVKRTVQLVRGCAKDGYEQTTVRVTSTNTAPTDAAISLPPYVTGSGNFGVPAGSVQTNIVAYGPFQAQVQTAKLDGQKTEFAPYFHSNRPVGVLAIRLAPGESRTVDFTFGKIVQHTEPNLVVTPTVQDVKDVTLPTETASCG